MRRKKQQRPERFHFAALIKHYKPSLQCCACIYYQSLNSQQSIKYFVLLNADNQGCVTQCVPRLLAEGVPEQEKIFAKEARRLQMASISRHTSPKLRTMSLGWIFGFRSCSCPVLNTLELLEDVNIHFIFIIYFLWEPCCWSWGKVMGGSGLSEITVMVTMITLQIWLKSLRTCILESWGQSP